MPAPTADSLIDRVDDQDRPIGRVPRGEALSSGAAFRTVHVFVIDSADRLLIQRLAGTRDRHPGKWGSSVAAYLYAGEDYQQAAERRLDEELGLREPLRYQGKVRIRDASSMKFVALYTTHSDEATIRERNHIAEIAWRSLAQLDEQMRKEPSVFTPTFLELYDFFVDPRRRERRSRPGPNMGAVRAPAR